MTDLFLRARESLNPDCLHSPAMFREIVAGLVHQITAPPADKFSAEKSDAPCRECGAVPTVGSTKLCGPHCFDEPQTFGGNWP